LARAAAACYERRVMSVIIEVRAAEGGADARDLVREQFAIYANAAALHGL
jgi:hypothetical protein